MTHNVSIVTLRLTFSALESRRLDSEEGFLLLQRHVQSVKGECTNGDFMHFERPHPMVNNSDGRLVLSSAESQRAIELDLVL